VASSDNSCHFKRKYETKSQSPEDAKFRKALENMQYKACTQEDIEFLHSHITGPGASRSKLAEKDFCNVSIITAWNSQKDRIN